jgi:hypothetical protein
MKKLLLSGVAFVSLAAAPALAADLSTAPLYKAPLPVPAFTWTVATLAARSVAAMPGTRTPTP